MHPMLNIAVRAARAAGDVIIRQMDKLDTLSVREKGRNDFVTEVDRAAEDAIIQHLQKAFPDHAILAEESGSTGDNAEFLWIIDPLDGTTNFIHGFPYFCVSIALQKQGKLDQAVVYNPLSQDLFTATRGSGAWLNNRRMRVSNRINPASALVCAGFSSSDRSRQQAYNNVISDLTDRDAIVRRNGAAALDLAHVAAGHLDCFFQNNLKPWDIAAGSLLVREAGGLVSEFDGGSNSLQSGQVVAGNPKMLQAVLKTIHPHREALTQR